MSERENPQPQVIHAGQLSPWEVGNLPPSPLGGWRGWMMLLGPGVLLAGASVGTGEWLFGPAVSAQYGATLLWLATLSIVFQVFANLEFMRYAMYCGEPALVGGLRTHPGPKFWIIVYAILELGAIWPYNAANAAVPLSAAVLGHLPGDSQVTVFGWLLTERQVVRLLGYVIFLLAFVPLIFGGAIYRMLEKAMAFKLVVVLGFLGFVVAFMVSRENIVDVLRGFVRFGDVPLRAETVIAGRHFTYSERDPADDTLYTIRGTVEDGQPIVLEYSETHGRKTLTHAINQEGSIELRMRREEMAERVLELTQRGGFFIRADHDGASLQIEGEIADSGAWTPKIYTVTGAASRNINNQATVAQKLDDVPENVREDCRLLVENKGLIPVNLLGYVADNGSLPNLDWATIAAFAGIAGAGGLTNVMFSNYARDKGWGMGKHVGAIPSAVGGRQIELSHNGQAFIPDAESMPRWRGWMRHIVKDQVAVWMLASFVGMALPCMMSLEFIRNAPVKGDRVAAMTAEGIAAQNPAYAAVLWPLTLLVGFIILAPGQVIASDILARRWTDIYWSYSQRAKRMKGNQVKYVYYGIMGAYCAFGLVTLTFFDPKQVATISVVIQNVGLGTSAFLILYINRVLLPRELRPNLFMRAGTFCCGVFFLTISVIVIALLA